MELRVTGWTFVKFGFNILKKILLTILIFFAGMLISIPFFILGEGEVDYKIIYYLCVHPGKYKKTIRDTKKALKALFVSIPIKYYVAVFLIVGLYLVISHVFQKGK